MLFWLKQEPKFGGVGVHSVLYRMRSCTRCAHVRGVRVYREVDAVINRDTDLFHGGFCLPASHNCRAVDTRTHMHASTHASSGPALGRHLHVKQMEGDHHSFTFAPALYVLYVLYILYVILTLLMFLRLLNITW